jgi:hypothetical protein
MDWLAVLAVLGTLAGVGVGGIITYESQKRLQERQRVLDLDEQKREMRREQLLAMYSKFNIMETQFYNEEMIPILTEDEQKEATKVVSKVAVELRSAFDDPNLYNLYLNYIAASEQKERIKIHVQIQSFIRDEIDKTFDPNFSTVTDTTLENHVVDPDDT